MKRFLAFAACVVVAVAFSGTAGAASFKGVVVAKDAKRHALVVAAPKAVWTVRAKASYKRFKVGQRVAVSATKRSDGTFSARAIKRAGRAKQVRFGAVVVQSAATRLILSGGGSVFALRVRGEGTSAASHDGLEPGDQVDVDADVKKGGIEAGSGDVDETGHVEMLVLEGIYLFPKDDGFDLAVVHRGLVHVAVPEGMVVPAFKAGDQIVVVVSVSAAGKFSFVKGQGEGKKTEQPNEVFAYGPLVERSAISVGVKRDNGETLRCGIASGLDVSVFAIGDKVKLYCAPREGRLVMKKMASSFASMTYDGQGEFLLEGTLTEASAEAAAVSHGDWSFRCANAWHLDLTPFVLGENALMGCRLADGQWRLFKLKNDRGLAYAGSTTEDELTANGMLMERSTSVVVKRDDGTSKACKVPAGMDLQGFRIGDRVKMLCKLESGNYVLVGMYSENASAKNDGTAAFATYGTVYYKNGEGIAVQREDHSMVTCHVPGGTNLDAFPLGTLVKIRCVRHSGVFMLAELQSESAHVVLEA